MKFVCSLKEIYGYIRVWNIAFPPVHLKQKGNLELKESETLANLRILICLNFSRIIRD